MAAKDDRGGNGTGRQLPLPLKLAPSPSPSPVAASRPPSPRPADPPVARTPTTPTADRAFRVIRGEGQRREETLHSRDDVVRLLVGTACDVMLKRISPDRAHEIQRRVDRIMRLFDRVPGDPVASALLRRELDDLEGVYRDGQAQRRGALKR